MTAKLFTPWHASCAIVYDSAGDRIADCNFGTDGDEERAQLMAVAPDLLAALQAMDKNGNWAGIHWEVPAEVWRTARAAIAKATNKEQTK